MNTRRHPRTMTEAFGPYTDRRLLPLPTTQSLAHRVYGVLLAVAIGVVLALLLVHHLAK